MRRGHNTQEEQVAARIGAVHHRNPTRSRWPHASEQSSTEMPKVLCLHAFLTSGAILQKQMLEFSNFQEALGPDVEFEFLDGIHKCTPADEAKMDPQLKQYFPNQPYFEWFNANKKPIEGAAPPFNEKMVYDYVEDSLQKLGEHMKKNGPYAGLLGFSQGGSLAHIFSLLIKSNTLSFEMPKALIIISSRLSKHQDHVQRCNLAKVYKLEVPSLVLYAAKDDHVDPDETRALVKTLKHATELCDANGTSHRVPDVAGSPSWARRE